MGEQFKMPEQLSNPQQFVMDEENLINAALEEAGDDEDRIRTLNQIGQVLTFATAMTVPVEGLDQGNSSEEA